MRILKTNINLIFIILLLIFSGINICIYLLDFEFLPANYTLLTIIYAAVFILHAAAALKYKPGQTKASAVCTWFMPLAALIFSGTLMFSLSMPENTVFYFEIILTVALASGFVVFFSSIKTKKSKDLNGGIKCALAAAVIDGHGFFGTFMRAFRRFRQTRYNAGIIFS